MTPYIHDPNLFEQIIKWAKSKKIIKQNQKPNPMSETLDVTLENALEAYNKADAEGKKLLINLFGAKHFNVPIYERVTTLKQVIAELGEDDRDVQIYRNLSCVSVGRYVIANVVLTMVAKVYNEGWVPDFNKYERKWAPCFKALDHGGALSFMLCDYNETDTRLGYRLCFKTENEARAAVKNFEPYYNDFLGTN